MKANMKIKWLDNLVSEIHHYCDELINVDQCLKFIVNIEYKSYGVRLEKNYNDDSGIVKYIKSKGRERSELVFGYLDKARLISSRIESLMIRGKFYGFDELERLNASIGSLLGIAIGIQEYAVILSHDTMYLANKDIQESLTTVVSICPNKIQEPREKAETNCLDMVEKYYDKLIG
ncbi:hypothetical protein [Cysteiniphilum sp. JM-1]|uniref:hypothetical protein n=1 Tax=Cysteiniphilum sp. JM-1 TaxID=2610891 RepID=UPI0012490B8D|nr:hypothetical protein [Cysteiniphilum sp. JM-1]